MGYDFEIERVISEVKKEGASIVCIQLPEGLKPKAAEIADEIEGSTNANILIWGGSCFGACDTPDHLGRLGVDLLVQWGHSEC